MARTKGKTPDKEITEAADRVRKRKEYRQEARNSKDWLDFLDRIGVNVNSNAKRDFFESVRSVTLAKDIADLSGKTPEPKQAKVAIDYERARITVDKQGYYHNVETGKFVSKTKVRNLSMFSERRLAETLTYVDKRGRFRDSQTHKFVSAKQIEAR